MTIYIIRHAEPDYSNDTLTPHGWEEANALADRLEKLNISARKTKFCDYQKRVLQMQKVETEVRPYD